MPDQFFTIQQIQQIF